MTTTNAFVVRMSVTNRSSEPIALVLEPAGEIYGVDPGQTRVVRYSADSAPNLSIDVHDHETKIWDEGGGTLELEE